MTTPAETQPEGSENQWLLRHEQNPNNIWENGVAYDPLTMRVVFHGGHVGRLYPQSTYTFLYDLAQDRWHESQAPSRPQRRCLISFAYLDSIQRFIACNGGTSHGSMLQGEVFGGDYTRVFRNPAVGPWLYDSIADEWEDCRTLPPRWQRRAHAPVAYDYVSDAMFCIGRDSLMVYLPRTNRVAFRSLPDELKNRQSYGLAADPARRRLVLFGGHAPGGKENIGLTREQVYDKLTRDDTWIYDIVADSWKKIDTKVRPPRGMPGHAMLSLQMVYHNPSGKVLLLQNGIDRYEADVEKWGPSELWSFDADSGKWEQITTQNPPPFMGLLTYAANQNMLIIVGGGRDGIGDNGRVSPALSRQLWTCRLRPHRTAGPADRPSLELSGNHVRLDLFQPKGPQAEIHRAEVGPDGLPGPITRLTDKPQFTDSSAERGKVYAYYAVMPGFEPSLPAFNQPMRPGGLRASVENDKTVVLRWKPHLDDSVVGYKVYRADGKELETGQGKMLTAEHIAQTTFIDKSADLSDGIIRSYWVTAINRLGVESGASPLAFTVPDAPEGFTFLEGIAPSNGVGVKQRYLISWRWPREEKIAGFNVYHATEHIDTLLHPGKYEAFWKLWTKLTDEPVKANEYVFEIRKDGPPHDYFYVRPVNMLGQEGFATDILSPTDRRFRP